VTGARAPEEVREGPVSPVFPMLAADMAWRCQGILLLLGSWLCLAPSPAAYTHPCKCSWWSKPKAGSSRCSYKGRVLSICPSPGYIPKDQIGKGSWPLRDVLRAKSNPIG